MISNQRRQEDLPFDCNILTIYSAVPETKFDQIDYICTVMVWG